VSAPHVVLQQGIQRARFVTLTPLSRSVNDASLDDPEFVIGIDVPARQDPVDYEVPWRPCIRKPYAQLGTDPLFNSSLLLGREATNPITQFERKPLQSLLVAELKRTIDHPLQWRNGVGDGPTVQFRDSSNHFLTPRPKARHITPGSHKTLLRHFTLMDPSADCRYIGRLWPEERVRLVPREPARRVIVGDPPDRVCRSPPVRICPPFEVDQLLLTPTLSQAGPKCPELPGRQPADRTRKRPCDVN